MIKSTPSNPEAGFTAVELLITLFIAAVFLFAGYQLYSQVLRDGSEADKTTQASLITYNQMRKISVAKRCGDNTNPPPTSLTPDGFRDFQLTTTITCPQGNDNALALVTVTANYKDGISTAPREVIHATYLYNK